MGDKPNHGLVDAGASIALAPEPMPIKNQMPFVQDLVWGDLPKYLDGSYNQEVVAGIAADILERKDFGIKKYGTALQPFNGRNPIVDTYQEVLDGMVYARQATAEAALRDDPTEKRQLLSGVYEDLISTAYRLKKLLLLK